VFGAPLGGLKKYLLPAAIIGFALWTIGVAYYAKAYGYSRAEAACQAERDAAMAEKHRLERQHADAGKKFEEDRKRDQDHIDGLEAELDQLASDKPLPPDCRLGPERLRVWNKANTGAAVSGKPAGEVRDPGVPAAGE
jgi:hypothetical protein